MHYPNLALYFALSSELFFFSVTSPKKINLMTLTNLSSQDDPKSPHQNTVFSLCWKFKQNECYSLIYTEDLKSVLQFNCSYGQLWSSYKSLIAFLLKYEFYFNLQLTEQQSKDACLLIKRSAF